MTDCCGLPVAFQGPDGEDRSRERQGGHEVILRGQLVKVCDDGSGGRPVLGTRRAAEGEAQDDEGGLRQHGDICVVVRGEGEELLREENYFLLFSESLSDYITLSFRT